jgi:predicted enzyme related to lactoylglutathione lyase
LDSDINDIFFIQFKRALVDNLPQPLFKGVNFMSVLKNPIGWFEIHVADMERACRFYAQVFQHSFTALDAPEPGMEIRMFNGDMTTHGSTGALVKHPMKQPSTEGVLLYFSCEDCLVQQQLAAAHGGRVFKEKFGIGGNGFIAIVGDSEGNAIGLHSFK